MYGASHQRYSRKYSMLDFGKRDSGKSRDNLHEGNLHYGLVTHLTDYRPRTEVTEMEPLRQMVALPRSLILYGIRGYCLPPTSPCFVHEGDSDTFRVHYHEDLHLRISRQAPNHPEWEVRMLEDWRLGEEKQKNERSPSQDYSQEHDQAA